MEVARGGGRRKRGPKYVVTYLCPEDVRLMPCPHRSHSDACKVATIGCPLSPDVSARPQLRVVVDSRWNVVRAVGEMVPAADPLAGKELTREEMLKVGTEEEPTVVASMEGRLDVDVGARGKEEGEGGRGKEEKPKKKSSIEKAIEETLKRFKEGREKQIAAIGETAESLDELVEDALGDGVLTPVEARRIRRVFIDGLKVVEVAAEEGVSPPAISKTISGAMKKLQEYKKDRVGYLRKRLGRGEKVPTGKSPSKAAQDAALREVSLWAARVSEEIAGEAMLIGRWVMENFRPIAEITGKDYISLIRDMYEAWRRSLSGVDVGELVEDALEDMIFEEFVREVLSEAS